MLCSCHVNVIVHCLSSPPPPAPQGQGMVPPPPRSRPPPSYSVAAQMAARINLHRLGRAHSHEGVTSSSGQQPYACARHRGEEGR